MSIYAISLFVHIVGAMGIFVALGLEWTGLRSIRNAMVPEQVRMWMGILKSVQKVGFVSMLATVVTGVYLMVTQWGPVPWILVTVGSLVLVIALSLVLTAPRMVAIGKALFLGKGALSKTFYSMANQPLLWISIQTRVAIALGIIFLKIAKPDLGGSLSTIGVAIVLGLVSALPFPRPERAQEESTDRPLSAR